MTIRPFTCRARSVYANEPAPDFIEWLMKIWSSLTPEQQATAIIEARSVKNMDGVMVGLWYGEKEPK